MPKGSCLSQAWYRKIPEMPHVDNKTLSNYRGILGQQVLMTFENLKRLILQSLSGNLLSDSFPPLLLYRTGYIVYHYKVPGFLSKEIAFY